MTFSAADIEGPWCEPELVFEVRAELAARRGDDVHEYTGDARPDAELTPDERRTLEAEQLRAELRVQRALVAEDLLCSMIRHLRTCTGPILASLGRHLCGGCAWRPAIDASRWFTSGTWLGTAQDVAA